MDACIPENTTGAIIWMIVEPNILAFPLKREKSKRHTFDEDMAICLISLLSPFVFHSLSFNNSFPSGSKRRKRPSSVALPKRGAYIIAPTGSLFSSSIPRAMQKEGRPWLNTSVPSIGSKTKVYGASSFISVVSSSDIIAPSGKSSFRRDKTRLLIVMSTSVTGEESLFFLT